MRPGYGIADVSILARSPATRWSLAVLGPLTLTLALVSGGAAFLGELTQLGGTDGCVRETPVAGDCADGFALVGAFSVAVSRDGKNVYVASATSDAVAVFARDKLTGKLLQLGSQGGCVSETGTGGLCANGKALDGAQSVAVSPDGKHVYVASFGSAAVAVFMRAP